MDVSTPPHKQRWTRGLWPLGWWFLLVLMLYGIRTHQRLSEQTHLIFSVTLQGQPLLIGATASIDGQPTTSGQRIAIGRRTFMVTHPKGGSFSTNLFIWYGEHNLGTIDLKRTMGILAVTADPPVPLLSIRGPEWSVALANSSGMTSSVPTDQYAVESKYAHWERSDEVSIFAGSTALWRIAPRMGAVQLSCNHSNTTFQLLTLDDRLVETGEFPSLITDLPEENYKLIAEHNGHQRTQTVAVKAGVTNDGLVEYAFGAAVLETEPPGASVQAGDGREWGVTPLSLPELSPGTLQVTLHRAGYEPVPVLLGITVDQTATFHTNLISTSYTGGMKSARQYMAATDYGRALEAVGDALIAKPGDADAIALQREATGLGRIRHAKMLGQQGDYIGGGKELTLALQSLPDNEEAKQLLVDFKKHEPEQIERERVERLNRGKTTFDALLKQYRDAALFDSHEFKTTRPVNEVQANILDWLKIRPAFQITKNISTAPETFEIEAVQELSTYLATSAGRRQCLIVGAQTKDDETQILYKVLEYRTEAQIKFSIGALIHAPVAVNYIPIHASGNTPLSDKLQAQLNEGVSNVTARIQGAIGH
jgi:hypothetical protein